MTQTHPWRRIIACVLTGTVVVVVGAGCAAEDSSEQSPFTERQQRALDDPFGYSTFDKKDDRYNVSHESPKGIKRDLDHVLNP